MEKVNKLIRELELEINKLEPKDKNYLSIESGDDILECEYEYSSVHDVTNDEFACLTLKDNYSDTSKTISLTLKSALNLHEHIGKLIKNYVSYELKLGEDDN